MFSKIILCVDQDQVNKYNNRNGVQRLIYLNILLSLFDDKHLFYTFYHVRILYIFKFDLNSIYFYLLLPLYQQVMV